MKNCLFCKHFNYSTGEPDYGEYTPGIDVSIGCGEGLWELDNIDDTEDDFRRKMISAETCASYEQRQLYGPLVLDLAAEVVRLAQRAESDKTRNPKYRAKLQAKKLAKLHNTTPEEIEAAAAHGLEAIKDTDPPDRYGTAHEAISLYLGERR